MIQCLNQTIYYAFEIFILLSTANRSIQTLFIRFYMANAAKATRPITPAAAVTCALAAFAVLDAEAEVL